MEKNFDKTYWHVTKEEHLTPATNRSNDCS